MADQTTSWKAELGRELDAWAARIEKDVLDSAASLAERYFDLKRGADPIEVRAGVQIADAIRRLKDE